MNRERQYIGARYVLKVYTNSQDEGSAEWEANTSYEPLTLVTYQNSSYISRKAVPATVGNPVANKSYWAVTGAYNGQIAHLQSQVEAINELIGEGELPYDAETIIEALNRVAEPFEYAVWIGDSYTGAASLGADADKRYSTRVTTMLGLTEKNYAVGGSGFLGGNRNYLLQATDAVDDFTTHGLDKDAVKYFFIGGTRNDLDIGGYGTEYITQVRSVIALAHSNFPNAQIVIIPCLFDARLMPRVYFSYIEALHYAASGYEEKITFIDNAYEWMSGNFSQILWQDGANVHWSVAGHLIVARYVYSALMGMNTSPASHYVVPNLTWNGNRVDASTAKMTVSKINHKIEIEIAFTANADSSAAFTLCNKSVSNLWEMTYFWYGDKQIMGTAYPQSGDSCDFAVYATVNKTGDSSGSYTMQVDVGRCNLVSGKKYIGRIVIDNGVMPTDETFQ